MTLLGIINLDIVTIISCNAQSNGHGISQGSNIVHYAGIMQCIVKFNSWYSVLTSHGRALNKYNSLEVV